ncbi:MULTISPECIES: polysaccharide biosynthesis/export family protein [unclassified Novosphingobium]|uniref:polysaccharide biosynthesis/export family protein n=1 Tax=unclassified Novosphingobium TaxID=2644732 RepID=UPI001F4305D2|nr:MULTISPECIES: polysaccharide biosynthesis/export family protein [unclassified Novosphingobium]
MKIICSLRGRWAGFAAAGALAVLSQGCATSSAPPLGAAEAQQGLGAYRLGAGDKLRVTVYNEPNLSGEYAVSSAGDIAFPLIGMVSAGGRTVSEVTQALTTRIGEGYMTDPRVSVEVLNYRPYYIMGEVQKPGEYPYVAGRTIEQAVAAAGGFSYRANARRVNLRRTSDPAEKSVELYSDQAVAVMPGDTIRVLERYF